jgi:tetratricopeptide (TPR) repeat protein
MIRIGFRTHFPLSVCSPHFFQTRACSNAKLLSDLLISAEEKTTKHLPALFRKHLSEGITEAGNKNFQNAIKLLRHATAHLPLTEANREYRDAVDSYIGDIKCKLQLIRNAEAFLTLPYDTNLQKLESLPDKQEQMEYICQAAHYLLTTSKLSPDDKDVLEEMESLKTDASQGQEQTETEVSLKALDNTADKVTVEEPNALCITEKLEQRLHKALDGHYALANAYIAEGNVEEALDLFEHALKFRQAIEQRRKIDGIAKQRFPSRDPHFLIKAFYNRPSWGRLVTQTDPIPFTHEEAHPTHSHS